MVNSYIIASLWACALQGASYKAKLDKVLGDIKGVKTYIDYILVLSNNSFEKHIGQLKIISGRLRASGLKVNAPKCSFWLKEIPYLGYVTTREGIKPDPKKVQGIIDIDRPATTTEARALIGMFQYYKDMWPSRSHILAPRTEAARNPKEKKIMCNNALKGYSKEIKRMVSVETLLKCTDGQ